MSTTDQLLEKILKRISSRVRLKGLAGEVANGVPVSGKLNVEQQVIADANNSSALNLTVGNSYTFTGTRTSSLGVAGIQVSLYTDKNAIVKVQQSPDGVNWDLSDPFYYTASSNFGVTVQAISSWLRVIVTTMSETTTVFRLQTALCPIVEAVPRTLDVNGNLKVTLQQDSFGNQIRNTRHAEMQVCEKTRLVGSSFEGGTIDSNFWLTSTSTGTVTQSGTEITITSGTANGHYARLYSVRRARFVAGTNNEERIYIRLGDTGTANVKRRWGVAYGSSMPTITDGAYFELDGTTFSIVTLKNTNETRVSSGSFNGQYGYTWVPGTTNTVYEILYYSSGVSFIVNGVLLHKVTAASATWSDSKNLHIWADTVNSGNSAAVSMHVSAASILRIGKLLTQPTLYYFASGTTAGVNLKIGAGNIHSLLINNVANNAVITLSDSTSAATPALFVHTAGATSTSAYSLDFKGAPFFSGLRLTVAAANASVTVIYE